MTRFDAKQGANLSLPAFVPLQDLPGSPRVTFGVVEPGPHVPGGRPLLRAQDIVDGCIVDGDVMQVADRADTEYARATMRTGDVVVVLVGRIGEAAMVTEAQNGWLAARSVAIVRFEPRFGAEGMEAWLHAWLNTPTARAWCAARSTGSAYAGLNVTELRGLPVYLLAERRRYEVLDMMRIVMDKAALNREIAAHCVNFADTSFMRMARLEHEAPMAALKDVAAVTGGSARLDATGDVEATWVQPADVLQSALPLMADPGRPVKTSSRRVLPAGTVLVAPRSDEVRAAMTLTPAVAGRGLAAVSAPTVADRMWLLHVLRSRRHDLLSVASGDQAREMRVRAFAGIQVPWPNAAVREEFARFAAPLHERAAAALAENDALAAWSASEWHRMTEEAAGIRGNEVNGGTTHADES